MDEASKLCDTIPPPQNLAYAPRLRPFEPRSLSPEPELSVSDVFDPSFRDSVPHSDTTHTPIRHSVPPNLTDTPETASAPARQLCVRHKRMADQGTNLKLQRVC
jgi:F-box and WD-40 domain protein MET30